MDNLISTPPAAAKQPDVTYPYLSPDQKLLNNLQTLINQNFRTIHDHEFYANQLKQTITHLNTITRFHLHKTIYELIQERLCEEAIHLLLNTVLSTKQISYELGFCDPSYFTKWFKGKQGVTPKEFRTHSPSSQSTVFLTSMSPSETYG